MTVYINFTTKISTFHARVFDASKIKIYLLKQSFDNLHIHLGLLIKVVTILYAIIYFKKSNKYVFL